MNNEFLIVGTYTAETFSRGIYCFAQENGAFVLRSSFCGCTNPSYLIARDGLVYAVQELEDSAYVAAFMLLENGFLRHENTLSVPGNGACHLSLHPCAPVLYVSNFGSGDLVSCILAKDGALGGVGQHIMQRGSGPLVGTQGASHLHSATPDASGSYLVTCNLGTDEIMVYQADTKGGLAVYGPPLRLPSGSGPRHFVFAQNGRFAYSVNELSNTVAVFAWEAGQIQLLFVQPLLPPGYQGTCYAADIHCSADGHFLYVSTRENNAVVAFEMNGGTGALVCIGRCETGGLWPRHFSFNSQANLCAVANQKSNAVSIVTSNAATGLLEKVVQSLPVPAPVCAIWAQAAPGFPA